MMKRNHKRKMKVESWEFLLWPVIGAMMEVAISLRILEVGGREALDLVEW